MELDERKERILKAIIANYMETGEPVGSRTISKIPDLNLSSATIRNEMSDLEDMGYIIQPYTSAGRIPSDKGYRYYVDEVLRDKELEFSGFKSEMLEKVDKLEHVLKHLAKILASNTNYATMIAGPTTKRTKIKFIQVSKMDDERLLVVTVFSGNIIRNNIMDIPRNLSKEELLNVNLLLNTTLNGFSIDDISLGMITQMKEKAGDLKEVIDILISEIANAFKDASNDMQIYTSGTTNIFKYPELSDGEMASKLIDTFEEKDKLKKIFEETGDSAIQVYIGEESPIQNMKDCSIVTANYEFGQGIKGSIGIIGPKRMDYAKVFRAIKECMNQLDNSLGGEDT